jgi:hypothetical protein
MAGSTPLTPGTTPTSGKSVVSGFRWDGQPVKVTRQVISGSIQCAPNGSCLGISGPTDGGYLQGNNWQSQTIVANSWFDPVAGIDIKTSPTSINGKSAYFSAMTCPADRFCMMVGWSGTTSSSKVAAQGVSLPFNGSPATFFPPVEPAGQEGVMSVQQPRVACATGQSCMLAAMVTVKDSTGATVVRLAGSQWAPAGT